MFITSKNKYLSNDMKIFGTCSIPLNKGPSIRVNHTLGGGGLCENQNFFGTLLTFWLIFIIFMGIFGMQKMLMCTLFWGEGVSESV